MSSSRLLDFFVLEATDYIDRLDTLLSGSGGARNQQPDAESLTAQARLLRGSATMARQLPIADLSSALERIGRAVRDGIIEWNAELHGALVAAVDDLKILIRAVRNWGPGDDRRTEARISELVSLYPQATKSRPTPPVNPRNSSFVASESAQLASALDSIVAHPSSTDAMSVAVHRLSSLRGVAAINDSPPLPQVLAALDDLLRPLYSRGALPETSHIAVISAAVQLLRRLSQEVAIGGSLDPNVPAVQAFNDALSGVPGYDGGGVQEAVIPISRLNFEDGQPQLVSASAQSRATPRQRFKMEIAGPCEHLRHQVALARAANDDLSRKRAADEMRATLRVLRSIAEGFEDADTVYFVDAAATGLEQLNAHALAVLDELSRALMDESNDRRIGFAKLQALVDPARGVPPQPARRTTPVPSYTPVEIDAYSPPVEAAPIAEAQPRAAATPMRGSGLSAALAAGIAGLSQLDTEPLSPPAHIAEDDVVPIAQLLYRGKDALIRAQEIRDVIRARADSPRADEIDEIFELLDLATAE